MFSHNLSKRERLVLTITISIAALAAAYVVVIEPMAGEWNKSSDEIKTKKARIVKNRILLARFKYLKKEYEKYPDLIAAVESEEKEVAKALSSMEDASRASSCPIADVKPRTSKKIGAYKEILFEVTTESGINELTRFLYDIETSKGMLRVKHFTIASKSGVAGNLKGSLLIGKIIGQ